MICARASINADTGASLFYISFAEAEYFQHCNALAHLNPSANSNKFELVSYREKGSLQWIQKNKKRDAGLSDSEATIISSINTKNMVKVLKFSGGMQNLCEK